MDQASHHQIKERAYYVSPKEENVIIWLPTYSSNPIFRVVFEIGVKYF